MVHGCVGSKVALGVALTCISVAAAFLLEAAMHGHGLVWTVNLPPPSPTLTPGTPGPTQPYHAVDITGSLSRAKCLLDGVAWTFLLLADVPCVTGCQIAH